MKNYPKIGIRPIIDGRQGGIRESLEDKTMNLAKAVAELISTNLRNGDGSPVECVIADGTNRENAKIEFTGRFVGMTDGRGAVDASSDWTNGWTR